MLEPAMRIGGGDGGERVAKRTPQPLAITLFGTPHQGLDLAKRLFNRIEVRGIGWQKQECTATRFNPFSGTLTLVHAQVVPDDDLAGSERGDEHLVNEDVKHHPVSGTIDQHSGADARVAGQGRQQGGVLPVVAWCLVVRAVSNRCPGIAWRHAHRGAALINEDQLLRGESGHCLPPGSPGCGILFTGGETLFCSSSRGVGWLDTALRG